MVLGSVLTTKSFFYVWLIAQSYLIQLQVVDYVRHDYCFPADEQLQISTVDTRVLDAVSDGIYGSRTQVNGSGSEVFYSYVRRNCQLLLRQACRPSETAVCCSLYHNAVTCLSSCLLDTDRSTACHVHTTNSSYDWLDYHITREIIRKMHIDSCATC